MFCSSQNTSLAHILLNLSLSILKFWCYYKWYWLLTSIPITSIKNIFCSATLLNSLISSSIFFFLERETMWAGKRERERERERENPKQAQCSGQSPMWGLIPWLWDHDLSPNQDLDAQPIEPPRCPSFSFFKK